MPRVTTDQAIEALSLDAGTAELDRLSAQVTETQADVDAAIARNAPEDERAVLNASLTAATAARNAEQARVDKYTANLQQILDASHEVVTAYAPNAPDSVTARASLMLFGDLFDRLSSSGETALPSGYFRTSGARAFLSPWHPIGASIIRSGTSSR